MKLLVCGSRYWRDRDQIKEVLKAYPSETTVIHGACRGADQLAGDVAVELGMDVRVFPADWDTHGRRAGMLRNQIMLDQAPDRVIAFHGDPVNARGTGDMMRRARAAGIPVEVHS